MKTIMQVIDENQNDDMLWILWRHGRTNTSCHASPSIPSFSHQPEKVLNPTSWPLHWLDFDETFKVPRPSRQNLGTYEASTAPATRHSNSHMFTSSWAKPSTNPDIYSWHHHSILRKWLLSLQSVWAKPKALCRPLQLTSAYGEMRCDETESVWNLKCSMNAGNGDLHIPVSQQVTRNVQTHLGKGEGQLIDRRLIVLSVSYQVPSIAKEPDRTKITLWTSSPWRSNPVNSKRAWHTSIPLIEKKFSESKMEEHSVKNCLFFPVLCKHFLGVSQLRPPSCRTTTWLPFRLFSFK